ncbi:helix-turn-helix transcriptional regulator [Candidatus Acetothermia bacterium]|nr:helix-turn-helix transcriptional regulator [Candidatus Acetothermia bacterium]
MADTAVREREEISAQVLKLADLGEKQFRKKFERLASVAIEPFAIDENDRRIATLILSLDSLSDVIKGAQDILRASLEQVLTPQQILQFLKLWQKLKGKHVPNDWALSCLLVAYRAQKDDGLRQNLKNLTVLLPSIGVVERVSPHPERPGYESRPQVRRTIDDFNNLDQDEKLYVFNRLGENVGALYFDEEGEIFAGLKKMREAAGLGPREMARRGNLDPAQVYDVEGRHEPRYKTLVRYLQGLGLKLFAVSTEKYKP